MLKEGTGVAGASGPRPPVEIPPEKGYCPVSGPPPR